MTYSFLTDPKLALEAYLENGYHIEENVLSDEQCEALINKSSVLENAKNKTFRPQIMPHRQEDIYLHALRNPSIVNIINQLVGGVAIGLQTEFFYCKPGTRGFALHQDNFFVEADYGVFASSWIALTDTTPEKGGLIVYPKSHKSGLLPTRKLAGPKDVGQDPNAGNEEIIVPDIYQAINVSVPKGAALFIHGHLVHGSNSNTTDSWRYVLLNTYLKKGEKFRAGNYAQREAVEL